MNFNKLIFSLREYCAEASNKYYSEYRRYSGYTFCGYLTFNEIAFKLAMLVDREFENLSDFKSVVRDSLNGHYDYYLTKRLDYESGSVVTKATNEFLCRLDAANENEVPKNDSYYRVIYNKEAETIIARFKTVWHYDTSYWFPLGADYPKEIREKIFVTEKNAAPKMDSIIALAQKNGKRVYRYGECDYPLCYCEETDDMSEHGIEQAYTDKAFSWFIYFSHEGTVAFAGSILPEIRKIFADELINKWDFE